MSAADPRRLASRAEIVRTLRHHGPLSRAQLTLRTGLSRATVSSLVAELQEDGLAVDAGPAGERGTGRPAALVRLSRVAGVVAGIDIDRLHLRVAVADLGHEILAERHAGAAPDDDAAATADAAAALLDEALAEAGLARGAVVAVGAGVPGPVNARSGDLGSSTILPGWAGVRASDVLASRLGLPVLVDNDANLGALGEWMWGAGRGRSDMAYVKVSAGIGCGLILRGAPYRGTGGTAGELGHTIVDPSGAVCRCGNRGCLETVAGVSALLELLEPRLGPLTMEQAVALAHAGDAACRRVIAGAGAAIGAAAANLCNLINPELVVVGGDAAAAGDILLAPLREALLRTAIPSAGEDADVVASALGDRAELLGAVALALQARDEPAAAGETLVNASGPSPLAQSGSTGIAGPSSRPSSAARVMAREP